MTKTKAKNKKCEKEKQRRGSLYPWLKLNQVSGFRKRLAASTEDGVGRARKKRGEANSIFVRDQNKRNFEKSNGEKRRRGEQNK